MFGSLCDELSYGTLKAFRLLVPLPEDRELMTWQNFPQRYAYVIPFYFLAYLARRKDTHFIRLMTLPTVLVLAIRGTYAYGNPDPMAYFWEWTRGMGAIVVVGKSLDYAFTTEGQLKIGETDLPSLDDGSVQGLYYPADSFLPPGLADANELIFSLRGIGWKFGADTYIPPDTRPMTRGRYLLSTLFTLIKSFLVFDFTLALITSLPGIGTTAGGSMFFTHLPLVHRYVVSSMIMLLVSVYFTAGFELGDALGATIAVGILRYEPNDWPPHIGSFWSADSLHDLWARQWHQNLRRMFLIFGGFPGQWLAGKFGMVMGTFLASGLYHESGLYLTDRGFDQRVLVFFLLNGLGVSLEWAFYKLAGRKVSGVLGRAWTWVFILGFGQMMIDSWFVRGLAGSNIVPSAFSPTHIWLMPTMQPWIRSFIQFLQIE
ncbi:hypothetical protein EIP91_002495 [Steccherinum ochraceum]|uniref:Wax synthase domain-containing protein n=1 Tax=Steccherinum ochraceum TaxID=92696 RepID=A0A4R0RSV2_9APHY|nr:hypothetical protein EIP91_002495 [Steccherinum ochraceum]